MSTSARQLPGETDRITRAIFEHASLISREQPGDLLVVVSDGIMEARNPNGISGMIRRCRSSSASTGIRP